MVKIRLKRLGRKKRPFYRLVVTDIRSRRDGAPVAELGYYDPLKRQIKIDKAAAKSWIAKGAQASGTAEYLIGLAPDSGELTNLPPKAPKPAKKEPVAAEA
jgi:small subunit ribosomal protein S16